MIETAKIVISWLKDNDINVELINLGGGFSIRYVEGAFNISNTETTTKIN